MEIDVLSAGPHSGPRVFDSPELPADRDTLERLRRGTAEIDLAAPAVVLPDFHHKSKLEMPSSIAVATTQTIRPTFTSSSVNCGMALIALDCDRPDRAAIESFYRRVRERFPYPPGRRRALSTRDVVRAAAGGGEFAADRYGVDPAELERVEEDGRVDLEPWGGAGRMRASCRGSRSRWPGCGSAPSGRATTSSSSRSSRRSSTRRRPSGSVSARAS